MARKTYVPLSTRYSENPKGTRARYNYTLGGLPPGATALVYDLLYQIEINNTYRSVVADNILVEADGFIRLTNLRDSKYSVQFQNIDHVAYNFEFDVGNPDEYTNLVYHEIPYPVILQSMQTGLDGSLNAYLRLTWSLDSHNIDGYYEIWLASGNISPLSYFLYTTLKNTRTRSYTISAVDYNAQYYAKIRTLNEDNLSRGFSNIVSGLTPSDPIASGVPSDTYAPINASFYPA